VCALKGILRSGKVIAVKKIYDAYSIEKDNSLDEISRVMGIMHPNVVQLIGYCAETKMDTLTHDSGKLIVAERRSRLLCFEYISNGGLHMYISS
jgi:coatomer subunit beta'